MDENPERPFGVALVAGWFAVGAVAVAGLVPAMLRALEIVRSNLGDTIIGLFITGEIVLAIALFGIAAMLWRDAARVRVTACAMLVVSAAAMVWRGATPWHYGVAAVNVIALVVLLRAQRARSM